ncbi:AmmeMemoRadiSam system protein A [uncultured Adlercreutzia sp.]|uniref:AmmeMemoRadiSam system protein A n=1 Tax=uncultured Adlercreutzia sp. TaxID=875803 RepID=UPI0026754894|nr:AmmeMemoRadiSam system protein A [uncultured Adlercreutzia sp.]
MGLLAAYAVPHPPLIVPAVGQGQEAAVADTTAAYEEVARRVAEADPDIIVIASPHAPLYRDGFFISNADEETGSMAQFGQPHITVTTRGDAEFAQAVADRLARRSIPVAGAPAAQTEIDHGAFVPLHFLAQTVDLEEVPVLRVGLSALSPSDHHFLGQSITRAAERLDMRCVLIASGDLSHRLKEDGPYGFNPAGPKFDRAVEGVFARGNLQELFALDPVMCENAAECGLRSFEIMAGALEGLPFRPQLLSYEGPFGVGYAIAAFEVEAGPSSTEEEVEAEIRGAHAKAAREHEEAVEGPEDGALPDAERAGERQDRCEGGARSNVDAAAAGKTAGAAVASASAAGAASAKTPGAPDSGTPAHRHPLAWDRDADDSLDAEEREANEEILSLVLDPEVDPLVALARLSVESIVGSGEVLAVPQGLPDSMTGRRAGAFVSLHKDGKLRGCIGTIAPARDCLAEEVIMNGVAAATEDPRFPQVRPDELDALSYSVDVLGEPEPVHSLEQLDPMRYGVIVTRGFKRGLLLPDLEGVDTVMDQLAIAKQKAGIRADEDAKIERFEVVRHILGGTARSA